LKKIEQNLPGASTKRNFDASVGKILSTDEVSSYQILDYDADKRDDVLLIKADNHIQLLENKNVV
jgi:hypothetical protein